MPQKTGKKIIKMEYSSSNEISTAHQQLLKTVKMQSRAIIVMEEDTAYDGNLNLCVKKVGIKFTS
jgi:hypothetical protein